MVLENDVTHPWKEGTDMVNNRAYAAYQNSKVLTASPAELTLMLYDGAIKFTNIAIEGCKESDIQKAHTNIQKCERIIVEFDTTLDDRYPVSQDFHNVYRYLLTRLHEANVKKEPEILEEVLKHLRTMRETWREVMRLNSGAGSNPQVS